MKNAIDQEICSKCKLCIEVCPCNIIGLNKNEELQKLTKKPYVMQNIAIDIIGYMPDYSRPIPPNLGAITLQKNKIIYYYDTGNFEKIHEETYEEALKMITQNEKTN